MTLNTGIIAGVSVAHSHAAIDQIEAAGAASEHTAVTRLLNEDGVDEAFVLQTCNRAEAYVVADDADTGHTALESYVAEVADDAIAPLDHETAIRHLIRVACGLESLVLGEDQILGQFREAYEHARTAGGVGPTLDDALLKAIHVGERAREETAINEGVVSLGSAAVELATTERDLTGTTAVVIGAGSMATIAAKALDEAADRIIVANRTLPHAEHVAGELSVDTTAVGLAALPTALERADVVISATASDDHIVTVDTLAAAGDTLVVDIAQPRDISPAARELDGITLRDLDALEAVTDETRDTRRDAAASVESMIDTAYDRLINQYKRKRADQVIAAMYEGADHMKTQELQTALAKLEAETDGDIPQAHRDILESLADALVSQLLSAPTKSLRDAAENDDWSTINTALQLFNPADDTTPPTDPDDSPSMPAGPDAIPEAMRDHMPDHVLDQLSANDND